MTTLSFGRIRQELVNRSGHRIRASEGCPAVAVLNKICLLFAVLICSYSEAATPPAGQHAVQEVIVGQSDPGPHGAQITARLEQRLPDSLLNLDPLLPAVAADSQFMADNNTYNAKNDRSNADAESNKSCVRLEEGKELENHIIGVILFVIFCSFSCGVIGILIGILLIRYEVGDFICWGAKTLFEWALNHLRGPKT